VRIQIQKFLWGHLPMDTFDFLSRSFLWHVSFYESISPSLDVMKSRDFCERIGKHDTTDVKSVFRDLFLIEQSSCLFLLTRFCFLHLVLVYVTYNFVIVFISFVFHFSIALFTFCHVALAVVIEFVYCWLHHGAVRYKLFRQNNK
jgi:hypothetical protein